MAFRNYILCFALVAGTIAGPINVQDANVQCATTCTESLSDHAKFQYTPGNTYVYTYEGTTDTRIHGSSSQSTNLKIQATANIEVLSSCEFALKLKDVSLYENGDRSSGSREFQQQLESSALRFSFQDGKIQEVCSGTGEDERVLNVKRGILSTFQNSMNQFDKDGLFTETDISGTCPTKYESKSGIFGGLTITKTKDILACVDRNGNISSIHSKRYMVPSKIQSLPLLRSSLVCEQEISSARIEKTTCNEELMFRPFSQQENGAVTKATQSLTYQSTTSSISTSQTPVERRSNLLFHHIYDESIDADAKAEVIATLQQICSEVSEDITKDTPVLFGTLVSHMKKLSTDKMMEVYTAVNGARVCETQRGKQFFFDAIPMVATEASVSMMTKMVTEGVVDNAEAEMWLTQLAFIPRPNHKMLKVIKPLLSYEPFKNRALLGVSAMVHKMCDNHHDCMEHQEIVDFVNLLQENIDSDCSVTTSEKRNLVLVTLKALGNAGDAVKSSSTIEKCFNNNDADMEVRIAAVQAFRRMPCSVSRDGAMALYQNADIDAELRIHAFMAGMSCPTPEIVTKVRMILSGEPVNQVGSFVWTYLENLKETSAPLKQELATILEDVKLREDFNMDVRKFSRNIEKSLFSEYLNAGAQVESNLIWSQSSYIPRSAMLNVSVEMFGNSINLVEMGGRVQGLEKIVERFFGPEGYFSKRNTNELIESKRQTANYVSSFDRMFKTPEDKITTSMYTKVFGNEIVFQELTSDDWAELQEFNVLNFLIKLAEPKRIDLTKNYQFLDSSLIVPTCVGLPMNLTVNGSASVTLDVNGNVDLRNFAVSPRNLDINGHIKPSAAVVVSGLMGVDAFVTKSTMKMVATMHTSTMIDGKIQLQDGEVFNVELNTPKEKMEIFHVETEFFMNGERMTMPDPSMEFKKCTPAMATSVVGMEMCVDVTLPASAQSGMPTPPFTGPMNAQVSIEKKDTHTSYAFTAKMQKEPQQISGVTYNKRTAHISLDTPGSQVDRKLLAEAVFDPANMKASAQLMTPWKKFSWTSSLENSETSKKALTVMKIDDTQEYSIDAELGVLQKKVKTVYSPKLSITMPNKPTATVLGTFEMGSGKTIFGADLKIQKFTRKPITFSSALTQAKGGESYNCDMKLVSDYLTTSFDGTVSVSKKSYNGRASLVYSVQGRPDHRFTASGKFSDKSVGDLMSYSVQAGLIPTEYPQYSFSFDTDLEATSDHIDTKLTFNIDDKKLIMAHKTTKQGDWDALSVESSSSLKYPSSNVDLAASLSHKHSKNELKSSATLTYAPSKTVKASIDLDKKTADSYKGEATLSYPGRDMSFDMSANKQADGERKMSMNAKWDSDADSQMSMTSSWKQGETHEVSADVKIPGYPVTLKGSIRPDPMNFMGEVDVLFQRESYSLSSSYTLTNKGVTTAFKWVCPHRTVTYDMSGSLTEKKATYDASLEWETGKKVTVSGVYNNKDHSYFKRDASLRVTSPIVSFTTSSDLEMTASTAGNFNWELNHNNEKCKVSARMNEASAEITIESPFIQYGPVKSLHAKYNVYPTSAEAEFSWSPSHKVTASTMWTDAKYELAMTTPFENFRSMKFDATSATVTSPYTVNVAVDSDKVYFSLDKSLRRGEFSCKVRDHSCAVSFNHNGKMDKFEGDVEMSWNADKASAKLNFNTQGPYTAELDITTPFEIKKMSANFHHEGQPMDFNTRGLITWNDQQVLSTLEFKGKSAELTVRSPWRNVDADYDVSGEMTSFAAKSFVKWGEGEQVKAKAAFDIKNVRGVKSSFSLESPLYETISGDIDYTGELYDHSGEASLSWGADKKIKLTEKFSMTNGLTYDAELTNPWTETIVIGVSHTGNLESWSNSATYGVGREAPFTVYSEFDSTKYIKGKVGVENSPLEYLNGESEFEYKVMNTMTSCVASVKYMGGKTVNARVTFDRKDGYELTASLNTPYTEEYSLMVSHTGDKKSFDNTATVQWSPNDKITTVTTLNTRYGFDAKMKVDSPWRQMSYAVKQQGNAKEFSASTNLSWETGKEVSSKLEFSHMNELKLSWSLKTPFEQVKDMSAVLTHRGDSYEKFYTQVEGRLNEREVTVGMDWDMTSDVKLVLNCANPWKDFNVSASYAGEPSDFTITTTFVLDKDNYSATLECDCKSGINMELNIVPVVIKPIKAKVSANGESNTASLSWGDNKTISAEAKYSSDSNNKHEAEVTFTTPFEGYETGNAKFTHTGTLEQFRDTAEVSFYGKAASAEFGFSSYPEYKGDFSLASPWYTANGEFSHSGDLEKFNNEMELTYAEGKTIKSASRWNMRSGVSAEWTMSSPFKNASAKWSHKMKDAQSATAHAELSWDEKKMESDLTFSNKPGDVSMEFTMTSPWKSVSATYTHQGTRDRRCNASAELSWDNQKQFDATWSVSMMNGFTTEVDVKTPWKNVSGKVEHLGSMTDFINTLSVTYDTMRPITLESEFKLSPEFYIKSSLTSPWTTASGSYRHTGTLESFTCRLEGDMDNQPITGDLSWNMRNGVSASVAATTPWRDVSGEFKTNDDMEDLTSSFKADWGTDKMDGELVFKTKSDYEGSFTANTPWRNVHAKFTGQGTKDNFNWETAMKWDTDSEITAEVGFTSSYQSRSSKVTVKTPWRNMSANYRSNGSWKNFDSTMDVTYDTGKTVSLEAKMNAESGFSTDWKLTSPWKELSADFQYSGSIESLSSSGNVSWEPTKKISMAFSNDMSRGSMSTTASVDSPWRNLAFSYRRTGTWEDLSTTTEFSWEPEKKITTQVTYKYRSATDFEANAVVNTPWKDVDASAKFNSADDNDFSTSFKVLVDQEEYSSSVVFDMMPMMATWTMKCPHNTMEASFKSTGDYANMDGEASFMMNGKTYKLTGNYDLRSGYKGEASLVLPERTISADFTHTGDMKDFRNVANLSWAADKKMSFSCTFKMADTTSGSFSFASPFADTITGEFSHRCSDTMFDSMAKLSWAPQMKVEAAANFSYDSTLSGSASLKTPFYDDMEASFEHTGEMENFNNKASISWAADKKIAVTASFAKGSPMTGAVTLKTPFFDDMEASFEHSCDDTSFDSKASASWAADKKIEVAAKFNMGSSMTGEASLKTPFYDDMEASFEHTGEMTDFNNKATVSWAADKKIEAETRFSKGSTTTSKASLKTPFYDDMEASFEHSCDDTSFDSKASASWATDKKIEAAAKFNMGSSMTGEASLKTPFYDDMEASFEHTGEMTDFNNKATVSWAADKKIEAETRFSKGSTTTGKASLKTPFYDDMEASFEHTGEMTDFNNKAAVSWAADKKVEGSVTFKFGDNIDVEALVKTPFYDDMKLKADMSMQSGEITVEMPFMENTEAKFRFTDRMNWSAEMTYGDNKYTMDTSGSNTTNGFTLNSMVDSPICKCSIAIDHQGDMSAFTNSVEGKWMDDSFKMTTDFDMPNRKISQTLEATGYERMAWSAEYQYTDSSFGTEMEFNYGTQKVAVDMDSSIVWKKYKAEFTGNMAVKTPFEDYEDNKVEATLEYSDRLFDLVMEGHKGSSANTKKFQLYKMVTKKAVNAYMRTNLYSDSESETSLNMSADDGKYTFDFNNDLKFHEASKCMVKVVVNDSVSSSGHTHTGSLEMNCSEGAYKLVWNAESDHYSCATGFTFTRHGEEYMTYKHKTTWNTEYTKLSQEITFKSPYTGFEDCESKVAYDFTLPKKSVTFTLFNDPSTPFDFKAELQTEGRMDMLVEMTSPCDYVKRATLEMSANIASQPWDVKVEGSLDKQTFNGEGHMEVDQEGKFDFGMSFKSQMPIFEDLQLTISNAKLNDQYKPHVVIQWASDKKVEMSGTFSWSSTYKVNVDLNTPFDSMRSLVTDITLNYDMPDTMDMSFDFKTNKMSKKLSGKMEFNRAATTLSVTAESPFETLSSFELTAALQPRLTLLIKKNGITIFNLNGNGRFDSWTSHDLEFTASYPFWNKYMHLKVNNDLKLSDDNKMGMDIQLEYMKDKEVTFKYTLSTQSATIVHMSFTSPFEKFESIKYNLSYDGTPQNWNESTDFEFYYGKVTTTSSFSMVNGFAYHQTTNGQMKNGWEDFNTQKDFKFTGDMSAFDVEASMAGSVLPTVSYSTRWSYDPTNLSLKATLNDYHVEYTHIGSWKDFSCNYLVRVPQSSVWYGDVMNEWKGNWTFKYTDHVSFTTSLSCPHHDVDLTFDFGVMDGKMSGEWKYDGETAKWSTNYKREESPYKYEGSAQFEVSTTKVETSMTVTKDSINWSNKYNGEEVFGMMISNEFNSDMEYKPVMKFVVDDETYEFDGLYKNEGEGVVRDFKLHMTGPKGSRDMVDFKFEYETQSAQLVPGDAKIFLSHKRDGKERTIVDLVSSWGNDHAEITFTAPQPMKYTMDFSVDTKGQSVELNAYWDTTAADKNFVMKFVNRFAASSRRIKSMIDIDVVYTGISRGFTSNLDWKTDTFAHKLTFDYNGKEIGYDWNVNHENGCDCSLELISEWRSMKGTWKNKPLSDGREMTYGLYWDSAKDMTKKFTGTTRWEKTTYNTYKWTTTFSHHALAKDITVTDVIMYDTSKYVFSFTKTVAFSADSSKDVTVSAALEKNGKWGVELKQDFNRIDMRIGTEFTESGAKGQFVYKATDGRTKNFGFETGYTPSNKALLVKLTTPMKSFELSTEETRSTWTAKLTVDRNVYETAVTVRPEDSYLLVKLTCPHGNEYQFECTSIENGYQMKLSRTEDGTTTTDALVAASMNENRTVNGKLYWNPTLYSELKNKIAVVKASMKSVVKSMSKASTKEATRKMKSLQLGTDFDSIMPHYQTEAEILQQDLALAKEKIGMAYEDDVFFMKSIGSVAGEVTEELMAEFAVVEERIMRFYDEVIEPRLPSMDAEQMRAELVAKLARVEERINNFKSTMSQKWTVKTERIAQSMEKVAEYLEAIIDKVSEYLAAHPAAQTLKGFHTTTMDKFNEASDMAYSKVSGLTDPEVYTGAIYNAHNYVSDTLVSSRLTEIIPARTIRDISDSLMYKMQFYYQYYDVADNMKMFIEHSRNIAADYLNDYLNHYIDEALNEFQWKQYDLENGRIEFEMNIPTRYGSVEFARVKADLKHRIDSVINHMAKYHFNMKEMFYMYKPQSFGQILPPYNAQAIIAGQHIRTFDRRHYDFTSDSCSYLLARDFQDGNFTVFVNYDGQEQSLTVRSNGLTIDIARDNTVKLAGSKVELPLQHFNTTVTRMGHNVIVSSTLGVKVTCDNMHEFCTVEMSGFYFAKTGGLFGTYNNEPLDDFTTSDNQNATDVTEFANSWASRCTGQNKAQSFEPVKNTKEYTACAAVFKDSSSTLQPCFAVVDPMNAFRKCINDMSIEVTLTSKNGPCKAAMFYREECRVAGVSVDEPVQCVTCDMDQTSIEQYETYRLPEPVMAVDIVFVVEEKMCNYDTDSKLPALSKLIDSSLSSNGYTDIRYGLVGFGGVGVHEPSHVHTMASKMFGKQNEFKLGTEALQFADGTNEDVFSAIDFAAQYPFRSGATKVIVVIPCSDCSSSALSYRSLAARLVSEDITLHVLNEFSYEITVEGKNPKTNYLFGIDNNAVFSSRDSRGVRGDTNLYPITSKPDDYCSSLALQTGGTVFDLNMMTKMRGSTIKNFQTIFANRMAMSTYPATCTTCSCEYNELFQTARSVCRKC